MTSPILHVVLTFVSCASAPALFAAPACTNADFRGVYGLLASGTIIAAPAGFPNSDLGPFARVARLFADGKGNIIASDDNYSYNGNLFTPADSSSGTYSVSSDCTVDVTTVIPVPGTPAPVPFAFALKGALADNGDSVALVICGVGVPSVVPIPCFTGPPQPTGNVIRVILTRNDVNQAKCGDKDLSGAFQLDMSGAMVTTGPVPGPFARDGRLVFDGDGKFNGQAVANYSGFVFQQETFTPGAYSVASDCSISLSYDVAGTRQTWTGMLTDHGNGANLIVRENGVVVTGTLKQQKPGQGPL